MASKNINLYMGFGVNMNNNFVILFFDTNKDQSKRSVIFHGYRNIIFRCCNHASIIKSLCQRIEKLCHGQIS